MSTGLPSGNEMTFSNLRLARKIVCVGRNYVDHAKELGNAVPSKPILFMKSSSSIVTEPEPIVTPPGCKNLHQEVELGVIIGKIAKNTKKSEAMKHVAGYTAALDMTARDWQDDAKKAGYPWFLAKSFDTSCPVTKFIPVEQIPDPTQLELFCQINGVDKQREKTNLMIWDIASLIEYTTTYVTLEPGDLLLTGTPKGVCKVNIGDIIEFGITGKVSAKFAVK